MDKGALIEYRNECALKINKRVGKNNMAKKKGFGVSPLTNTIFYGTQDTDKHM